MEEGIVMTPALCSPRSNRFLKALFLGCVLQFSFSIPAFADFVNGGFEDTYTPSSANTYNPITGWTQTGYLFNGNSVSVPASMADINLTAGTTPGGISDMVIGANQTFFDYFLVGATPTSTLLLPVSGSQSVMINLRSIDDPLTKSGTTNPIALWTSIGKQATALNQQITVQSSDIDSTDHMVHVRLKVAPVLENPAHLVTQQPFFAIQLNNITTGRTGANPLFFEWNYSGQSGVPWNALTAQGSNPGSNTSYQYTDWQALDIAPGNAFIHVGDVIELVVLASGCSPGGHDGHIYVDDVHTYIPAGLWVYATGPSSSTPGNNITYTYHYSNAGDSAVNNVQVVLNLPVEGNPSSLPAPSTTFVSVTNPTIGTSASCTGTGPVTCNIGTLQAGQSGTFQLTVAIPSGWALSTGPVNNGDYPISGTGVSPLLGPLVQTNLVAASSLSNLIANASGLPTSATVGTAYAGSFTCMNSSIMTATGDAPNASCDVTNLPTGVAITGCTISPSNTVWTQPATIPSDQTVTCSVAGTPTTTGSFVANVTTNAANNSNSTENSASTTITVSSRILADIPATLDGAPVLNPAVICCGRPVILGPLNIPGNGPTTYQVTNQTGDVVCQIGQTQTQTYLKVHGRSGSCTIVGTKNNVTSNSLTVYTP